MITILSFLQAIPASPAESISLFSLLLKGGWVMIPLAILFALLIFVAVDSWVRLRQRAASDELWLREALFLLREGDYRKAFDLASRTDASLSKALRAALEAQDLSPAQAEEQMQVEIRQAIARFESPVGYLGMIASIAPMLGFLGTIFGVIVIFMNISATNELNIASISDGLYQKMLCSGVGLLEGILAYSAYWFLNRRVDRLILGMDRGANALLCELARNRTAGRAA